MTFHKFLEKIEKTNFPIQIKKVIGKQDKYFPSAEEVFLISLPEDSGNLIISPDSVADIKEFHDELTNYDTHYWTISFKCKRLADLSINKPVEAAILIPLADPDFQTIKDKWEGWNCK